MSKFFEDPELYRSVLENLPIGIYVLDREERVRFWNRGAEQITGYLAHEVMGQVCRDRLPHCDPQGRVLAGDHCSVTTTFRDGRAVQNHVFTLHKQGHRLGVQIRTLPLLDNQGLTMGVAVAFEEAAAEPLLEATGFDRKINDEVFLTPGVDRPFMKSLWTQTMRWIAVTEDGLDGGPVMVDSFDGSPKSIEQLRLNIERSGEIGQLVAPNFNSTIIFVPLLDPDPRTGQALDYGKLSAALEQIRSKYERDGISLHITGFGKIVGDLIAGLRQVLLFFGGAILICTGVLYAYTRCVRSTLLVVVCSLIAVMWLCGILALLGRDLDPYSILVPLYFSSHLTYGAIAMGVAMAGQILNSMTLLMQFVPTISYAAPQAIRLAQIQERFDLMEAGRSVPVCSPTRSPRLGARPSTSPRVAAETAMVRAAEETEDSPPPA